VGEVKVWKRSGRLASFPRATCLVKSCR